MQRKRPSTGFITLILSTLLLMVFGLVRFVRVWNAPKHITPEATLLSPLNTETCLTCHVEMTGFSPHHDPKLIGCTSCHLGDGTAEKKEEAHLDMILIPGNLSDAARTCGKCHASELEKVQTSLMTTNSGIVAVDKFVFGESDSPDSSYHIEHLGYSAADRHLRDLCALCHLGGEKTTLGQIDERSRGGGCNACHLNYSAEALAGLEAYLKSAKKELPSFHPATDIRVSDEHCFGCHSRSSRISTNYLGWSETLMRADEVSGQPDYKVFADQRVYHFNGEDVHHQQGLLCIDCHSSPEVMGDGTIYRHAEDAVKLHCNDCHTKGRPTTVRLQDLDAASALVYFLRDYQHGDQPMLATRVDGHPLVNTVVEEDGSMVLIGKKDGVKHPIKRQPDVCARDLAHQNLSCSACHAQWTSRCIGCHNSFDQGRTGYDLLARKDEPGQWVEHVFEFGASKPALGVQEDAEGTKTILPTIPGMILTIDRGSYTGKEGVDVLFRRLYAMNSPHTTGRAVRDCESCHTDAMTLGYGQGTLTYTIVGDKGTWSFTPVYAPNEHDGLPEDAWIPFLQPPAAAVFSTRSNFRPFSVAEQKRILRVGACLHCHDGTSEVMQRSLYEDFAELVQKRSNDCVLPE